MIIYLSIVSLLIIFKLWWDIRARKKFGRTINHAKSAVIDTVIYIASTYLLFHNDGIIIMIGWVLLAWSIRWLLFDLFYNILMKNPINYYRDKGIDKFMKKLGNFAIVVKIIALLISISIIRWL